MEHKNAFHGFSGCDPYQHSSPDQTWREQQGSWVHLPPVGHTKMQINHVTKNTSLVLSAAWHKKQTASLKTRDVNMVLWLILLFFPTHAMKIWSVSMFLTKIVETQK